MSSVRGLTQVKAKLKALSEQTTKILKTIIATAAFRYDLDLKNEIRTGGRTGIIYKRGAKSHQASAPGEPPKADRGELVNSIHIVSKNQGLTAEVKSKLPYAGALELGTSKVAARPAWLPVAENLKLVFEKDLDISLNIVIKRNSIK